MQRPAAILFDVGDTVLIERQFDLEAGIRAALPALTEHASPLATTFRTFLRDQHNQDREPLLARWLVEHVRELAHSPVETVEETIWPAVVTLELRPGVEALLRQLRSAGVFLGAVSNAYFSGRILQKELKRQGLDDFFGFVLTSGDVGWRKPAVAIFEIALRHAGVRAGEAWFVGDTYVEDIVGAARVGMTPIWMRPASAAALHDEVHGVEDWTALGGLWHDTLPVDHRT